MALVTSDLVWIKQLVQELKFCDVQLMKLYCDNQAALHIASNPVFHERTNIQRLIAILFRKSCSPKKSVLNLLTPTTSLQAS